MSKTKTLYEQAELDKNTELDMRYREGFEFLSNVSERIKEGDTISDLVCKTCGGSGEIEIIGDGDNFECDVIGYKKCPSCHD